MEREGLQAVIDTLDLGYPPELRDNAQRFAAFRARWLGGDPISYGAIYRLLAGMDLAPELPRIACPVLVLWGSDGIARRAEDPLASWRPWCDDVRGRGVPGGHFLPEESPAEVLGALLEFFRRG